jgi:hypothetical protein
MELDVPPLDIDPGLPQYPSAKKQLEEITFSAENTKETFNASIMQALKIQ